MSATYRSLSLTLLCLLAGCSTGLNQSMVSSETLAEARAGFKTSLRPEATEKQSVETPPAGVFSTITYASPAGNLAAYLSPDPGDGKKHPAIIWITGGDCNSIGDVWSPAEADNDQTASAYREAGIVMMYPSLRGGNENPGTKEGFLGEVNDILAAADHLAKQPYVDPQRIYLGGHSTGGTLVLLVAEMSDRFRGVFSFGPVGDVAGYGQDSGFTPFDVSNKSEVKVRSPGYFLSSIKTPVWVIEGESRPGNIGQLNAMKKISTNAAVHFVPVAGQSHFSVLKPLNAKIAKQILNDTGPTTNISL